MDHYVGSKLIGNWTNLGARAYFFPSCITWLARRALYWDPAKHCICVETRLLSNFDWRCCTTSQEPSVTAITFWLQHVDSRWHGANPETMGGAIGSSRSTNQKGVGQWWVYPKYYWSCIEGRERVRRLCCWVLEQGLRHLKLESKKARTARFQSDWKQISMSAR